MRNYKEEQAEDATDAAMLAFQLTYSLGKNDIAIFNRYRSKIEAYYESVISELEEEKEKYRIQSCLNEVELTELKEKHEQMKRLNAKLDLAADRVTEQRESELQKQIEAYREKCTSLSSDLSETRERGGRLISKIAELEHELDVTKRDLKRNREDCIRLQDKVWDLEKDAQNSKDVEEELTLEEISEKFNIPLNLLRIKK
jgi:chromosome segregation ATPase